MKLCLIRHGHAMDHNIDELRQLSEMGRKEATNTGLFLRELNFKPQKVFHSDLVRAKETALLVRDQLGNSPEMQEDHDLRPNSSPESWHNNLLYMDQDIVVVGHMPFMGIFASEILKREISFPTGGALILEIEKESASKVVHSNFTVNIR